MPDPRDAYDPWHALSEAEARGEVWLPVWAQDPRERRRLYPTRLARFERLRYRPQHTPGEPSLGLTAPTLLEANRAFNGEALKPFEPRLARYVVPWREGVVGPLKLKVALKFRFFSPRLLRALASRHPELVSEQMIDERLMVLELQRGERLIELE